MNATLASTQRSPVTIEQPPVRDANKLTWTDRKVGSTQIDAVIRATMRRRIEASNPVAPSHSKSNLSS